MFCILIIPLYYSNFIGVTQFYSEDEPLIFDEQYERKESYYGLREALATITPGGTVGDSVLLDSNEDENGNPWGYQWMNPDEEIINTIDSTSTDSGAAQQQQNYKIDLIGGSGDERPDWEL